MTAHPLAAEPDHAVDMGEFAPYAGGPRLTDAESRDGSVNLTWDDGTRAEFPLMWLRDHCACEHCRHPRTRERLVRIVDLPETLPEPSVALTGGDALHLQWPAMPGFATHESLFDAGWLYQRADALAADPLDVDRKTPWTSAIADALPVVDHHAFMNTADGLSEWLQALNRYGFALLRNGPTEPGEVVRVAERVGWPRETNFGRHFDVVSMPDPNNAAYTAVALEPHVDLPNWQRPPDFQLLYCLANEAQGGESTLTDGLAVARALRERDPDAYRILAATPIDFRFQDENADIHYRAPVIGCDDHGNPAVLRFNNWIRDSLRLPAAEVNAFYRAYRRFWQMLRDPEWTVRFMLAPGEMIAFDNLRVLHGRETFDPNTGHRHLQGTYLDRDLIRSRQRVLERSRV